MKTKDSYKKLTLNKKTVAHLNGDDMDSLLGGFNTYDSCAFTNDCPTIALCTGDNCQCTYHCTWPCPISRLDCETGSPCI